MRKFSDPGVHGGIQGATGATNFGTIGDIINTITPFIIAAALIFLLIYLVMGGLGILTSKGDPKALEVARGKITSAIVGFFIIFIAYWLVQLLARILGLDSITDVFK